MQYSMVYYGTVKYCTVQYVQYSTVWYSIEQHSTVHIVQGLGGGGGVEGRDYGWA